MYRSGLVPRGMAMLGLIGGPLIIASGTAVLFNVIEPGSAPQFIATIPEFAWELSPGIYLMVKGFKPSPILSATTGDAGAGERAPTPRDPRRTVPRARRNRHSDKLHT
jgi:gamma-glutamyltranspeptidase